MVLRSDTPHGGGTSYRQAATLQQVQAGVLGGTGSDWMWGNSCNGCNRLGREEIWLRYGLHN